MSTAVTVYQCAECGELFDDIEPVTDHITAQHEPEIAQDENGCAVFRVGIVLRPHPESTEDERLAWERERAAAPPARTDAVDEQARAWAEDSDGRYGGGGISIDASELSDSQAADVEAAMGL